MAKRKHTKPKQKSLARQVIDLSMKLDLLTEKLAKVPGVGVPIHHGQKWTPQQEDQLDSAFAWNWTMEHMATKFGRTRFSIFMRLVKLGKVTEESCYRLWYGALDARERVGIFTSTKLLKSHRNNAESPFMMGETGNDY